MTTPLTPQDLEAVLQPVVEQNGLYLEEIKIQASGKTTIVRITVDALDVSAPAVTLDEVAEASRAISDALDGLPTLHDAYTLEVSSPGTNRPLTSERHFARAIGRLIFVKQLNGEEFTQRLLAVSNETLEFEKVGAIPLTDVRKAKVEVELKRADQVADSELKDFQGGDADTGAKE